MSGWRRARCRRRCAAAHAVAARRAVRAAASLGGCASMSDRCRQAMSSMPVVGLPASAPQRPAEPWPIPRSTTCRRRARRRSLTDDEQQSMETRTGVRARQQLARPPPSRQPAPAAKPAAKPAQQPQGRRAQAEADARCRRSRQQPDDLLARRRTRGTTARIGQNRLARPAR